MVYLLQWQNFRRFYLYIMTDNYRNIITRHKRMLLSPEIKTKYSLDEKMIVSAGTLPDLDEAYSRYVIFLVICIQSVFPSKICNFFKLLICYTYGHSIYVQRMITISTNNIFSYVDFCNKQTSSELQQNFTYVF